MSVSAQRLGLSRAPMREALAKLQSEGLVALNEIDEICEELAASHTSGQRDADDIREVTSILARIDHASSSAEWVHFNAAFDRRLYVPGNSEVAQRGHRAILSALKAGDREAIARLVRAHLRRTRDRVTEIIRDTSQTGEHHQKGEI